jgi:pimeloyl-ACP methyl ester carboxylesterase
VTLFFIPGFMLDADLWRDIEADLQSFGPFAYADMSKDGSIEALAERALADAPRRFSLIGFSMGGYVAREMAWRAPERVQALVLIATSARGDGANQNARKASAFDPSKFNGLSRGAIVKSLHPDRAGDTDKIERIRAMGQRLGPEVYIRQAGIVREDGTPHLSEIQVPALVIAGAQDVLRSLDEARELQRGIPGATMAVIEDTGHMMPIEAPQRLSHVLGTWLRSVT